MKNYDQCPLCFSPRRQIVAVEAFKRHTYKVAQCDSCQLLYTCYQEKDTNEGYNFTNDEAKFVQKYEQPLRDDLLHDRRKNYEQESQIIKSYAPQGNYLDVGCNAGWLMGYVKRNTNLNLHGVEPSKFLADLAANRTGAKVYNSYLQEGLLPSNHFDLVTMTDVFEHIPNPHQVLKIIHQALRPGGYLLIKVPNGSFTYLKYRLRHLISWALHPSDIFDAKEHLVHYDRKNLLNVLKHNHYEIKQEIAPLPIQTKGSRKITVALRKLLHASHFLGLPQQDLMVIAQKEL